MKVITCKDTRRLYQELLSKFKKNEEERITHHDERVIKYVEEHREEYSWVSITDLPDEIINDMEIIYSLQYICVECGQRLTPCCFDILRNVTRRVYEAVIKEYRRGSNIPERYI